MTLLFQVKVWFQNRRTKFKRVKGEDEPERDHSNLHVRTGSKSPEQSEDDDVIDDDESDIDIDSSSESLPSHSPAAVSNPNSHNIKQEAHRWPLENNTVSAY